MPPAELDSGSQINHDLDAVKAGLPGQAKDAIQATSVQRSGGKGNFHRKVTQCFRERHHAQGLLRIATQHEGQEDLAINHRIFIRLLPSN